MIGLAGAPGHSFAPFDDTFDAAGRPAAFDRQRLLAYATAFSS